MENNKSLPLLFLIHLCDVLMIIASAFIVYGLFNLFAPERICNLDVWRIIVLAILCFLLLAGIYPPIVLRRIVRVEIVIRNVMLTSLVCFMSFTVLLQLFRFPSYSRLYLIFFFLLFSLLLLVERLTVRYCVIKNRKKEKNVSHVLLVGAIGELEDLYYEFSLREYGMVVDGIFTNEENAKLPDGLSFLGRSSDVLGYIKDSAHKIDGVYCCMASLSRAEMLDVYRYCENNVIRFCALPIYISYLRRRMVVTTIGHSILLSSRPEPLRDFGNQMIKRMLDLFVSGVFLLTLFPIIYIVVAVFIKKQSPGPIFFRQKRSGYGGRDFYCLKFRSMHVNKDADRLQATKDDPRKFAFGDFMRRTSIDELPQFINVFMGDMSIVGPRPHMLAHTEEYGKIIDKYMVRHWVKPGITGWAQVNGFRGETRELSQMERRVHADIWYVENWTFWLDVRIIFHTFYDVLFHKGQETAY